MPGIVSHRPLFGRGAECVRDALGGALVIGRKGNTDVAVVEYGVVFAISLFDLVHALGDQEGAHAIAGKEGKARLAGNSSSIISRR